MHTSRGRRVTAVRWAGAALALGAGLTLAAPAAPAWAQECRVPSQATGSGEPRHQQQLAYDRVSDLSRGAGVTVAVVDTGIDAAVPQLVGRVTAGPNLLGDAVASTADCAGHGTFLAGLVAARPAAGSAVAGIAPDAGLVAVRRSDGRSRGQVAPAGPAVRAAADTGARVILFGAPLPVLDPAVLPAVAYAADRGALVVTPGFELPRGAVAPDELPDNLVRAAGTGSTVAELTAPGVELTSISRVTGGEVRGSGDEMAAALVAGAAALVWSRLPELTAPEVKARLLGTGPGSLAGDARLLDPLGALTTILPEQAAAAADPTQAAPIDVPAGPPPNPAGTRAAIFVGLAVALAAVVAGVGVSVRGARRRHRTP